MATQQQRLVPVQRAKALMAVQAAQAALEAAVVEHHQ
jgi:hypothetical protein